MRIFTLSFFFLAISLMGSTLQARQDRPSPPQIRGQIVEQGSQDPMIGANVVLKTQGDSLITSTTTGPDGKFSIAYPRLPVFKLEITYVGFEKVTREFSRGMPLDLGVIAIREDSQLLGEVVIEGETSVGEMKGDTAVFNASAFRTRENAMAEDLIGKLPGVTIENGQVQAQGEQVQKVLVDGREFFGSDPSIALRNLPADAISSVEVLDQRSDQSRLTGLDDGNYAKTINIITKGNMRNSYFGRVYGGYGTDNTYSVGGNINFFNGNRRISIIGMSNNVNQQNFASDDLLGVSGGLGGGGRRGGRGGRPGGGGNSFGVPSNNGIITTNSLGLNYSDKWGEKINFTGSYFFNATDNTVFENTNRETVISEDQRQLYQESQVSTITNNNHRMNARMEYDINEKNALIISPSINFQDNFRYSNLEGLNLDQSLDSLSDTRNLTENETQGYSISNNLTYRYKFDKVGRTISADLFTSWNQRDQLTDLISSNKDYVRNAFDTLVQETTALSDGFNYRTNLTYTEPISEKSVATLSYQIGNNKSAADQKTFQLANEQGIMVLDTALSNEFDNKFLTQRAGLGYRYNNKGLNINMNLDYQYAVLDNESEFPTVGTFYRDFKNLMPTVTMNYRNQGGTSYRFRYRTRTDEPSVNQLQNVINNSNPLNLSVGNPSLGQSYNHSMFVNMSRFNMETNKTFFVFLFTNFNTNFIGTNTFVAPQDTLINNEVLLRRGGQITSPVNLNGQMNARLFLSYGTSIPKWKTKVNLNPGLSYGRTPGIINGQTNTNENIDIRQGVTFASNISKDVDFTLSTTGTYTIVNSSLQSNLDQNYFIQSSNLRFYYSPNDGKTFIANNVNNMLYRGLSEGLDQSVWLWNIEAGYRFLKNNKGELKVYVFDLLKQNNSISRSISDVAVTDTFSNVLTRYGMISFTYIIGNFKKSDLPDQEQRPGGYSGGRGARSW
ncbi:Outer membrane receptor proteins, mostly Fe transport [Cyclobacterium xiamenense]|uniref:Outer membrane receptor proteins, mostly Fe transport n=1 Tax=Cyclobacterium xiamenense TaxID=1297121 RepID=A0A1H6VSK4_9BACT|nr:outer membrane beta-barrel protein [Cyclobacterium xiamenense]SEJ07603.1 Outer membrane receptor proteins, mostly Fe transport [Cyclobacterium xiamenense]